LVGPSDPVKGFNYLAISQSDAESIKDSIATGRALENGMVEISSTIETFNCSGVEYLMGSGLIVGESSAAQDETCTLNYITARSVWIGAYLVCLGQPLVVQDNVHGIRAVGDWLSFVPAARGQTLSVVESRDAVTREMEGFPPPDRQWSDNAVIEYLVPLGKPEFHRSRQKTIAVEDDSDALSPRTRSATQLAFDGIWRLRPARGGRHAGSLPTRKVTTEILTATAAPMGSSPLLWRWSVVAGSASVTAPAHSGQCTSEREKNDDDSDVVSKIMWKSTSTATLSVR
jgi:Carboxyl transferase domain